MKFTDLEEQEIVSNYLNRPISIEKLASQYKIGKIKLKKILLKHNVEIKKKGGQLKYDNVSSEVKDKEKILQCKKCLKEFNDYNNKSGSITNHLKKCYPNIEIPSSFKRRMFLKQHGFHFYDNFFNTIDVKDKQYLSCPKCTWRTLDINNKTGALTKHIEKCHGYLTNFLDEYPDYKPYFSQIIKIEEKNNLLNDDDNFVTCEICGESHKILSNTHLKTHNISPTEYKEKFNDNIISKNLCEQFKNNFINCDVNFSYRSKAEIDLSEFIQSLGIKVINNTKNIIPNVELDIYLPDYNLAIEFNGLYWHSEKQGKTKNYHLDKTNKCLDKNIKLIHIFSDEWQEKSNIIKNRIKYILNIKDEKIYARKCEIVSLTKEEKKKFLEENHLQGNDKSSIFYGLKFNSQIVCVLTFGKLRKIMGNSKNNLDEYEIYRYSSLNVVGGFSKLLKHFIKEHNPKKIITYSDRNWTPSDKFCFYGKLGFEYLGTTKPNYYYTKKYVKREHRYNFRKDKLVKMGHDPLKSETQIMFEIGYDRVWDTGNLKYVMSC